MSGGVSSDPSAGAELKSGKFRLGSVYARNAEAVLRGERGDDAHAEGSHGGHGLEVGLYACTAAGIGTGNGEYIRRLYHKIVLFA